MSINIKNKEYLSDELFFLVDFFPQRLQAQ